MAAAARMWKPKAAAFASVVSECQLKWKPIYLRSDVIRCSTKCFGRIWSWNLFLAHAEIGDFDVTILIQEDVVQLEIAINDAMSVKKEETNSNFRRVKPVKIVLKKTIEFHFFFFNLHSDGFFEFSKALNLVHEITTVDKLHDKVESIHGLETRVHLHQKGRFCRHR